MLSNATCTATAWRSFLDHSKRVDPDGRTPAFEEYKQWSVVSRLVHLGYNVLVVDTDLRLLLNPYPAFKDPAMFGRHNLITQAESYGGYPFNVGVLYVQNATVSGPVRSVFSEMVRRYELFVHLDEGGWRAGPDGADLEPGWREIFKHVKFEESLASVDDGGRKAGYGVRDAVWWDCTRV